MEFIMDVADRIESQLEKVGKKKIDMANYLGIPAATISTWKKRNSIGKKYLNQVAEYLRVSTDYLLGKEEESTVVSIPIVGTASCGGSDIDHLQEHGRSCYYNANFWHHGLYCVIADGDSMAPEIDNGDEVICDPSVKVQHGDMVHYKIYGESAIKVLVVDEDAHMIQLVPYNPSEDFKTRTIRKDDDVFQELVMSKVVAINKMNFNNRSARLKMINRG